MSIKDITVIIATFKSREIIKACLNSIDKRVKVILIENSNDIEIKNEIEKEFSNVECLLAGENLGYGKSNNIGLKKVTSKYALILNPDTTLHPLALENFLKTTKKIPESDHYGRSVCSGVPQQMVSQRPSGLDLEELDRSTLHGELQRPARHGG